MKFILTGKNLARDEDVRIEVEITGVKNPYDYANSLLYTLADITGLRAELTSESGHTYHAYPLTKEIEF